MGSRARDENADVGPVDLGEAGGFLRALPGGQPASGAQTITALALLAILILLVLLRRGFRGGLGAGHLHIGGADAVTVLLYILAWTAILRTFSTWLSTHASKDVATAATYFIP